MYYKKESISFIKGFSSYQVDTNGVIYSKKGHPLKPSVNHKGYLIVNLLDVYSNRKGFQVHRIVAEQFIQNPLKLPTVNHINGDKSDNRVVNLEWATYHEQMQHSLIVLNRQPSVTRKIYGKNIKTNELVEFNSMAEAARFVGCGRASIQHVASGRKKSAKGYFWSYTPFE